MGSENSKPMDQSFFVRCWNKCFSWQRFRASQRPPRRRALSIACTYRDSPNPEMILRSTCHDIDTIKDMLKGFGWRDDEITVLCDAEGATVPKPTGDEIVRQLRRLVDGAQAGDLLFLHMSGHASQVEARSDVYERDLMDEYFLPCDFHGGNVLGWDNLAGALKLMDDDLRKVLVDPLPAGVKLVAVIDCCSAGTILDLPVESHDTSTVHTENTPLVQPSRATLRPTMLALDFVKHLKSGLVGKHGPRKTPKRSGSLLPHILPQAPSQVSPDDRRMMTIVSSNDTRKLRGTVISIASCHDGKMSYETAKGGSLVSAMAEVMKNARENNKELTLPELYDKIKGKQQEEHDKRRPRHYQCPQSPGRKWSDEWAAPVPQFCFSHEIDKTTNPIFRAIQRMFCGPRIRMTDKFTLALDEQL